jgi:metallophosphoesterase (TIGR00282 family)
MKDEGASVTGDSFPVSTLPDSSFTQRPEGSLRVLFLGDVCAEPGRKAVEQALPGLRERAGAGFIVVNAENTAAGYGITPKIAESLLAAGVDCITAGDHIYDRKEVWEFLGMERRLLRPLNYPPQAPGRGYGIYDLRVTNDDSRTADRAAVAVPVKVAVVSLLGRVFLKPLDCPFRRVMPALDEIRRETPVIIVDMHAEATAEKQAMGWFLDGRVSAVLGSHTHVQTADETVLPGGTAYLTDVGMCGSFDSVLGMNKELSLRRMIEMVPVRLHPATGDIRLSGAVVDIEVATGRALAITRFSEPVAEPNQTVPETV